MIQRPTLAQVAKAAGVAVSTVSRVLSGRNTEIPISAATVEKVKKAARELEYVPSAAARALRTGRFQTIGVLAGHPRMYTRIGGPGFMGETISGVMCAATGRQFHVTMLSGWNNGPSQAGIEALGMVDGLLILNRDLGQDPSLEEMLSSWPRPVVHSLEYPATQRSTVSCTPDDVQGGTLLAQYCFNRGHKRIGVACWPGFERIYSRRIQGVREGLKSRGLGLPADHIIRDQQDLPALLQSGVSAIVCGNESTGNQVAEAVQELGLDIEIVVFGFINSQGQPSSPRPMVGHTLCETIQLATDQLIDLVEGKRVKCAHIRTPYVLRNDLEERS